MAAWTTTTKSGLRWVGPIISKLSTELWFCVRFFIPTAVWCLVLLAVEGVYSPSLECFSHPVGTRGVRGVLWSCHSDVDSTRGDAGNSVEEGFPQRPGGSQADDRRTRCFEEKNHQSSNRRAGYWRTEVGKIITILMHLPTPKQWVSSRGDIDHSPGLKKKSWCCVYSKSVKVSWSGVHLWFLLFELHEDW